MAKKVKTRGEIYRELMEKAGRSWSECVVLSFLFESEYKAHLFHFELMETNLTYWLFDTFNGVANVIVPADSKANERGIGEVAMKVGGKQRNAML